MPLNQSGVVDKSGLQNLSEIASIILEYTSESDFNNNVEDSGVTHDTLADHAGTGTVADGYEVGSVTEGLVAYYPLDEGAGRVARDGALDNLGQINGATWNGSGQVGSNALSFDGTDDKVDITSIPTITFDLYTVCGWFESSTDADQGLFGDYGNTGSEVYYTVDTSGGGARFFHNDGSGADYIETDNTYTDGAWHHIAFIRRGAGASNLDIYVDGSSVSTTIQADNNAGAHTFSGSAQLGARNDNLYMNGLLDDIRIYGRALSQPEIETIATRSEPSGREVTESDIPSQSDNGVSRYEFENDVTDSWGSNNGTDNTSAGFTTGVYGQAKSFDGTDDQIPTADIDVSTVTISAWFNYSGTGFQILLSDYDQSDRTVAFGVNGSDQLYTEFALSDTSYSVSDSEAASTGVWIHGVYTWDGTTQRLYKNGRLVGTNQPGQTPPSNDSDWHIGSDGASGGSEFNGDADDLRIYSAALSQREVEELYNRGAYRINRGELV